MGRRLQNDLILWNESGAGAKTNHFSRGLRHPRWCIWLLFFRTLEILRVWRFIILNAIAFSLKNHKRFYNRTRSNLSREWRARATFARFLSREAGNFVTCDLIRRKVSFDWGLSYMIYISKKTSGKADWILNTEFILARNPISRQHFASYTHTPWRDVDRSRGWNQKGPKKQLIRQWLVGHTKSLWKTCCILSGCSTPRF